MIAAAKSAPVDTGRHRRVHDGRDARRHDRADQRRARAEPDRELRRVALLAHVADFDRADPGGVGQRSATHPREAEADADVHVGQAGTQRAEQQDRRVVQPVGDLRPGGHDADQDEQRNGQQRPAVDPLHDQPHGQVRASSPRPAGRGCDGPMMANAIGTRSRNSTRIAISSSSRLMRRPRGRATNPGTSTSTIAEDGTERDQREADDRHGVDEQQRNSASAVTWPMSSVDEQVQVAYTIADARHQNDDVASSLTAASARPAGSSRRRGWRCGGRRRRGSRPSRT